MHSDDAFANVARCGKYFKKGEKDDDDEDELDGESDRGANVDVIESATDARRFCFRLGGDVGF